MTLFNIENIIDLLATKEILIILAIIGIILFVYFILWFVEFMKKNEQKKRLQNNTMELNKLVEEVARASKNEEEVIKVEPKKEEVIQIETIEEKKEPINEIPEIVIDKNISSSVEVTPVVINSSEIKLNTNDSIVLNDKYEEKVEIVDPTVIIPVSTPKNEEEVIKYKDEVYTETEAKKELERITEELKKLENQPKTDNIKLTKFETEQEENAIISLDELLAKGKDLTEQNEITQYQDDGNEPISIEELERRYKEEKEQVEVLEIEKNKEESNKVSIDDFLGIKEKTIETGYNNKKNTFHTSPVISPIYGIEKENVNKNTTLELENTANLKKFDDEIRKTNEFLTKLKELQQKLD